MGLIILGVVLLIILLLLFSPIRVYVEYLGGKPKVILKYLFIKKQLVGGEEKKKKAKKPKKAKEKPKKKTEEEADEEKKEKKGGLLPDTLSGKIDFFKALLKAGGRALKRLLHRIKIKDIFIDFTISDEDAYECAIKFGKTNIIVYNAFTYLSYFLRLKKKSINIKCVYNKPDCVYDVSFTVCVTPGALLAIGIAFVFAFLVILIRSKKKAAASQEADDDSEADNKKVKKIKNKKAA